VEDSVEFHGCPPLAGKWGNDEPNMALTRVVLADDHPMIRAGINNLLKKAPDIEVVGEAANGAEAIQLVDDLKPDVLLLDVEMPVIKGVEVARRLQAAGSPVRILVLSAHDDRQYILGMLACGVAGYLTKEEGLERIVDAIRHVAQGEQGWVSQSVEDEVSTLNEQDRPKANELTEREVEILNRLVEGKSNAKIAAELGLSVKTIEKHMSSVFTKLKVSSRVEAADFAIRSGLV
jgi:DNA-binding NarL/FixJ family response regulator